MIVGSRVRPSSLRLPVSLSKRALSVGGVLSANVRSIDRLALSPILPARSLAVKSKRLTPRVSARPVKRKVPSPSAVVL